MPFTPQKYRIPPQILPNFRYNLTIDININEANMNKAIFLDRDGTLNIDHGYVHHIDQFEFIEGSIDALLELKQLGYLLVLVTNQSGIARGYFSEKQFLQLTQWIDWSLADRGVDFDGIYYCPHLPDGIGEYRQICDCRKPQPGMLLQAAAELHIDLSHSFMVGDKIEDMIAGHAAGITHTVLVRTGKPITPDGEHIAEVVLDSISNLPQYIKQMITP